MSSTFFGIGIASSGIAAQKRAMDILGYNIANANDPTYKRQRVVQVEGQVTAQAQESSVLGATPFGAGVGSGDVERVRDTLIENRMQIATQSAAQWDYRSNMMTQIESILNEPSDDGLQNDLDQFWNSWQEVATSPDSLPVRSGLIENANALSERMQYIVGQFRDMTDDLNLAVQDKVDRINVIGKEIAKLNNEIGSLESGAMPINDLQNRRDALVQELSKLVNVNQYGDGKESYMVSIGGTMLVQGTKFTPLSTQVISGTNNLGVVWSDSNLPVNITNGELNAALDIRDELIPSYMKQLDNLAVGIVEYVNSLHTKGYDMNGDAGENFFVANDPPGSVTAANLTLNPDVLNNPDKIAASAEAPLPGPPVTPVVGNGEIAKEIAELKDQTISQYPPLPDSSPYQTFSSPLTLNQMYRRLVGDIGSETAIAERQAKAQQLSYDQFAQQQQSISGVSLDEEMTNMIKFQQAYNASSRVLSVMNEMLDVLINSGK